MVKTGDGILCIHPVYSFLKGIILENMACSTERKRGIISSPSALPTTVHSLLLVKGSHYRLKVSESQALPGNKVLKNEQVWPVTVLKGHG